MTQPTSSSEELLAIKKQARRRLVGAVALVLVALTVLWNVLDSEPKAALQQMPAQTVEIVSDAPQIRSPAPAMTTASKPSQQGAVMSEPVSSAEQTPVPAVPGSVATLEPSPVKPPVPESVGMPVKPADSGRQALPAAKAVKPAPKPAEPSLSQLPLPQQKSAQPARKDMDGDKGGQSKSAKAAVATDKAGESKPDKRHIVQFAALSDADKVSALLVKLASVGVHAHAEQAGNVTRVRVGPFGSREQAEKIVSKAQSAGVSGLIISR